VSFILSFLTYYLITLKIFCHLFTGLSTPKNTEKYKKQDKRLAIVKQTVTSGNLKTKTGFDMLTFGLLKTNAR